MCFRLSCSKRNDLEFPQLLLSYLLRLVMSKTLASYSNRRIDWSLGADTLKRTGIRCSTRARLADSYSSK